MEYLGPDKVVQLWADCTLSDLFGIEAKEDFPVELLAKVRDEILTGKIQAPPDIHEHSRYYMEESCDSPTTQTA